MGKAFDSIRQGLDEAIAHAQGNSVAAIVHHPRDVDVAALRKRIGMTQQEFAAHQEELMADWNLARQQAALKSIAPLE